MIREFRVLPTDPRFRELEPVQMEALYQAFNELPEQGLIKRVALYTKEKREILKRKTEHFLPHQMEKRMRKMLMRQGKTAAEADDSVRKYVEIRRKADLKRLDDAFKKSLDK